MLISTGRLAFAMMISTGLLAGCVDSSTAPSPPPGIWSVLAPMPTPRGFLAAAELGGKVYAIGGYVPGSVDVPLPTDAVEVFDPSMNSWTTAPHMPVALGSLGAAVVNGRLYAVGGTDAGHTVVNTLQAYDPATDMWTVESPMPTARRYPAVAVVSGILYVIGGRALGANCCAPYATVEAYDPATDTWSAKAPMPTAREAAGVAVVNGTIFVLGGSDGTNLFDVVEAYDPSTNTWSTQPSMPAAVALPAVGVVNDTVYVAGGVVSSGKTDVVRGFSPSQNEWWVVHPMPTGRYGAAGAVIGRHFYAVGGDQESVLYAIPYSSANEMFAP